MLRSVTILAAIAMVATAGPTWALSFTLTRLTDDAVDAMTGLVDRQLAVDALGRPHAAFVSGTATGYDGVFYAWKSAGWQIEEIEADTFPNAWPAVDVDADDAAHVAFCHWTDDGYAIHHVRVDEGVADPPETVAGGAYFEWPSLAVGPDGRLHAVFATPGGVGYSRRSAGGWTAVETIAAGRMASIAVDSLGHCHVAYEQVDTLWTTCVWYVHGTAGSWSVPEKLAGGEQLDARAPSIAIGGGRVWVAYDRQTPTDYGIETRFRSSGTWSAPDWVAQGTSASIAVNDAGEPFVAYWKVWLGTGIAVSFRRELPSWIEVTVDSLAWPGFEMTFKPSIALGPDGGIHVLYNSRDERGGPDSEIWYAVAGAATDAPERSARAALRATAFPNPARALVHFAFEVPAPGSVRLDILDARGRLVHRVLHRTLAAGTHTVHWDGRDQRGLPVAGGVYIGRLVTATGCVARKVMIRP